VQSRVSHCDLLIVGRIDRMSVSRLNESLVVQES